MAAAALSLWDRSAEEPGYDAALDGDGAHELVVVGGGYTGLSTALHAAEAGIDTHVLEAATIGHGGSGRNVGLVNAGLWLPPQDVRAKLGERLGAGLIEMLGAAPGYVFSLIERHQIRCEPTRTGTLHAAHSVKGYDGLARRAEEWRRLGAPVRLLSRAEAAVKIGSEAFHGGLLDARCGTVNPMGYARGLARAARGAGARISTGAPARGLRRAGDAWVVETDRGALRARWVVLGVNAYADALWPGLANSFMPIHYFQVASAPLGERGDAILPERQGLWDTAPIMTSARRDAEGRLILGSMGRARGGVEGLAGRWATATARRLFPGLGPVRFETAWHGRIAMTPDHLPKIHRLAEGLYAPSAYNGRGVTTGTVFGKAIAALLAGGDEQDLPLPVSEPTRLTTGPALSRLYDIAFTLNQAWRAR